MKKLLFTAVIFLSFLTGFAQQKDQTDNRHIKSDKTAEVLIYSFFRDNGQDGIHLAWSEDGIHFKALNNDQPVMKPAPWKDQNLTRDPSIVYHEGLFRAVWTSSWKGDCFGYAESADLIHWSEPVMVEPFSSSLGAMDKPQLVWAPEICWDPVQKNFAIIWTSVTERDRAAKDRGQTGNDGNWGSCQYISRTTDGKKFTPAKVFFKQNFTSIDGFLLFDDQGKSNPSEGRWIMVLKDEREVALGGKNIRMTSAPADFSQPFVSVSEPVAGSDSPVRPKEMAEGPSLIKWKGKWFLYWDAFANSHYSLATSNDLKTWTDFTDSLVMPEHPRHGTIFKAPKAIIENFN